MTDSAAQIAVVDEMLVPVGGYRLRVLTAGEGPAVLLLHGFLVDADDWLPTIVELANAGYRVIAPDALGFGHSDKPGGAVYNLGTYADLNVGLLDALGVERATLVGHSMGGKHALATAVRYPERVARLVIADSEGFMTIPLFMRKGGSLPFLGETILAFSSNPLLIRLQLTAAFANPTRFVTPELVERGRHTLGDPHIRRTMLDLSRHYSANDLKESGIWPQLAEIRCPTLIIWGAEDRMFPVRYAHTAQNAIPGSQLVVIPDCGHFPQIEAERQFNDLLLRFLAADVTTPPA